MLQPATDGEATRLHFADRLGRERVFEVEIAPNPLSPAAAERWIERHASLPSAPLLAVKNLIPKVADRLRAVGRDFIDGSGNCFLTLDGYPIDLRDSAGHDSDIRSGPGLRPDDNWPTRSAPANLRALFALLADSSNRRRPTREIASRAGTSYQTVSKTLAALRHDGTFERDGRASHRVREGMESDAIERFVLGWRNQLRPQLELVRLGSNRTAEDDEAALERVLTAAGATFGFGGSAGAFQIDAYYRSSSTVVHLVGDWRHAWNRELQVAPSRTGSITILQTIGADDIPPGHQIAHPLLLYAELRTSADPREREFAQRIRPLVDTKVLADA